MFYSSIGTNNYWLTTNGYLLASTMGFMSAYYHTFHIVNPWHAYVSKRMDYIGIVAVNLAHQQLDTHIIFFMIFKSPCLFYIATAVEICFAIGCVVHISSAAWAGKFWAITYPILSSVPLTAITVANSHLSKNIEIASSYSLGCSVLVVLAGTVFYMGQFPERCYEREGTFDYCSSHFWFHLLIVASILSAFGAVPYV
jgi:predicted membrane channel-forming protein YqfA (hemolysin III family)